MYMYVYVCGMRWLQLLLFCCYSFANCFVRTFVFAMRVLNKVNSLIFGIKEVTFPDVNRNHPFKCSGQTWLTMLISILVVACSYFFWSFLFMVIKSASPLGPDHQNLCG